MPVQGIVFQLYTDSCKKQIVSKDLAIFFVEKIGSEKIFQLERCAISEDFKNKDRGLFHGL